MAVNEHDDGPDAVDARIASLYRQAAREEPPARVDRAIASAARRPPGEGAPGASAPWWLPWRVPFAVAAVAVLSVSLVTLMTEEDRERVTRLPTPQVAEPELAQTAPDSRQAAAKAPEAEREAEMRKAPQPRAQGKERSDASDDAVRRRQLDEGPLADRPSPPQASGGALKAPAGEAPAQVAQDVARDSVAPRARLEAQPYAMDDRAAAASGPPLGASASAEKAAPSPPAPAAKPAPPPPAKAAAPPPREPEFALRPAPKPAPPEEGFVPPPTVMAKPAAKSTIGIRGSEADMPGRAARPSPEVARHLVDLDKLPSQAWIERVLALRKEGRIAEADGVLAELRKRFPDVTLPPELR